MSSSMLPSFVRNVVLCLGFCLASRATLFAQTNYYGAYGTEYPIVGQLPGDQLAADVSLNGSGGFVVWQDNATGRWVVNAERLDATLSGALSAFPVSTATTGDERNPRVAMLKSGGAVFVWQGDSGAFHHIYARFMDSSNIFLTATDMLASVSVTNSQINPAVTVLTNGNVVVAWSSIDEAAQGSMQDVYGRVFSPAGQPLTGEFLMNQFTNFNQDAPAIAALNNGGFVAAWVSEQERALAPNFGDNTNYFAITNYPTPSVDIYARLYDNNASPLGGEFLVNSNFFPCANPAIAAGADGGCMITWCAKDTVNADNSWDIYARSFSRDGNLGPVITVNTHLYGDQYTPRIASIGTDYMIVWTSLGQDGSREGVYGQFVHSGGFPVGGEFRVNTTTINSQVQPVVASDGASEFLAVWSSFTSDANQDLPNFDLFAQRYLNVSALLPPITSIYAWAPFTLSNGVYQPQIVVTWPELQGISISNYEVYLDGAAPPAAPIGLSTTNFWIMTAANGLATNATHSFTVDYVTTDGRRPLSLSPSASATTWSGQSWGGIPYEWMAEWFGGYISGQYHTNYWMSPNSPVAPGGPTLLQVFQSGGNPYDSSTWLVQELIKTPTGLVLSWNTQPGHIYQVQVLSNMTSWTDLGQPRLASGTNDWIYVGTTPSGLYRELLLR